MDKLITDMMSYVTEKLSGDLQDDTTEAGFQHHRGVSEHLHLHYDLLHKKNRRRRIFQEFADTHSDIMDISKWIGQSGRRMEEKRQIQSRQARR
jgi:hypothetical protein